MIPPEERVKEFRRLFTAIEEEVGRVIVGHRAVVRKVLPQMSDEKLDADFPEAVMGLKFRTGTFLVHLCSHAGFHLGQAGYLRRIITRDSTSSGPVPLGPLASHT